jgi:hypothetical protein
VAAQRFAKVPAHALEAIPRGAFTYRQLVTYLACCHLATYTEPRTVRASVGAVAEAAGIDRTGANRALLALEQASDVRPALITYRRGKNQHTPAVITMLDGPACVDSAQPDSDACATDAHPNAHPDAHPRHALPAQTSPLEPESQRKNKQQPEHIIEAARRISRWSGRNVTAEQVGKIAADSRPSELRRAVESLVSRDASDVRSPLAVLKLAVADERGRREAF